MRKTLVEVRLLVSKEDHDALRKLADGAKMPVSEMVYYLSQRGFASLVDEQAAAEQAESAGSVAPASDAGATCYGGPVPLSTLGVPQQSSTSTSEA